MIIIDPNTRQFNVPGADLTFGVESDAGSTRKYFQCPRYVGDNLDLMSCFVRMNFRNANGEMDSYLVDDVTVDGDNVVFSWVLSQKVTLYKGQVKFVVCAVGPNQKVEWHTTLGAGMVLEGLEPDFDVEAETADVVAQLIAMVEAQTAAVEAEGGKQIKAVQTAAKDAEAAAVAEIEAKGVNTKESIPDDYTALSEAVGGLARGRAGAIVCEAAGSAVVVNDASDLPIQGMRIFGRSTQDGVPTPDAPVEIKSVEKPVVTVCGKNLIPYPYDGTVGTKYGVTVTENNGVITLNGTVTENGGFTLLKSGNIRVKGKYTLSGVSGGSSSTFYIQPFVDGVSQSSVANGPYTFEWDGYLTRLMLFFKTGVVFDNKQFAIMLEKNDSATEHECPRTTQTLTLSHALPGIPVTSGGNYTDSDGQQWICDEVDFERGVYVKRIGTAVFDGSDDEQIAISTTVNQVPSTNVRFDFYQGNIVDVKIQGVDAPQILLCNYASPSVKANYNGVWLNFTSVFQGRISLDGNIASTVEEMKALIQEKPLVFVYPVATPVETTLSETEIAAYRAMHSNYPNTTVLNNAGAHMAVAYAADTKLYIDNKIKEALR